ncbi:MAG TPA: Fur family transcriptional regulator [Anaerolineaceae bacterium]|nr:Fur family transcriptional regulator [Anaerolineaceae bacterium]HPN53237.1 Fur family transcriptional regulator [Anaerolineaceae bacterium]
MTSPEQLINRLRQAGMRITPQRVAICRMLSESRGHPTAAMVFEAVREQHPSLSLMTVYNTLNMLVSLGAVNLLGQAGDEHCHYDAEMEPHVNLACVSCHRIVDFPSGNVSALNQEIAAISGYTLLGARVLYYGLCPDCQAR